MKKIIWVYANSNSLAEANKIGKTLLKERLIACYGLVKKYYSVYYWPPRSGKLEKNSGPQLVLETIPKYYGRVHARVKQLHSDKVPFIGFIEMQGVSEEFYDWMDKELKSL